MSAPELPEVFGNYALGDFVEVVSPQAISWLPQTAGWAWLAAALAGLALYRGWQWLRRWYQDRYRREAQTRLEKLTLPSDGYQRICELNRLLKLTAMVAFSRQQVAKLSGNEWPEFLNRQCPDPVFTLEQGQLLAHAPYRLAPPEEQAISGLIAAASRWINEHENPAHV